MNTVATLTYCLGLKIKIEWFRALLLSIKILYMQKRINSEKMRQKQGESGTEPEQKREVIHTLGINFIA